MARINLVSIFSGRRGSGKSYNFLNNLLPAYRKKHSKKRVLVVDTLNHPMYKGIPQIKSEMLERWTAKGGVYRIFGEDPETMLNNVEKYLTNALVVFEDASKYIEANLQNSVKKFVLDSKQKNVDVIFMFHGFAYIPPKLLRISDAITIFKSDDPEYRKKEIVAYEDVKKSWQAVMADPNPYAQKTVRLY